MSGRHRRASVIPRWLVGAGLGAAALLVGSLAWAPARTPLPTFEPGPAAMTRPRSSVEPAAIPPVIPTTSDVSTPPTTTPGRRVRATTGHGVDTTAHRLRQPTTTPTTATTTTTGKTTTTATTTEETTDDKPDATPAAATCSTTLEGARPHVAAAGYRIKAATGFTGTIYGRAGRAGGGDHPKGLALDFMTGDGSAGPAILAYVRGHFAELGATYAIYRQTYYPAGGGSQRMEDRGSPTANHFDHVHVSFAPGGGVSC